MSKKINIYVAVSDISQYFEQKQNFLVYRTIQKKYGKNTSLWRKILYYFGEKEIKEQISQNISKDLKQKISKNMFFDEEINSLVHRSHIEQYYPLSSGKIKDKNFDENSLNFDLLTLNKEINKFILRIEEYKNDEDSVILISRFLTTFFNDGKISNKIIGSDILSQILLYRANVDIAKLARNISENLDINKNTFLEHCKVFEKTYQELPFVFRLLGLSKINVENVEKIIDNLDKFDNLLQNNYNVILHNIKLSTPAGLISKNNIYRTFFVRVGQGWKRFPWWMKILTSLIVFGGTAYFGGPTIVLLPIFVFIRQYLKTKGDLYEGQQYNFNSILNKDIEYISKLNLMYQQRDKLNFTQKRRFKDNYKTIPYLITQFRLSVENVLSRLSMYVESRDLDKIKEIIQMTCARLQVGSENGLFLFSFDKQENKELTFLSLYKYLILGGVIVGWNLGDESGIKIVQSGQIYQDVYLDASRYVKLANREYKIRTGMKALRDGFVSGIVAGFTGRISSTLLHPVKTVASVYASDTMTKIVLDKNSPLWDVLHKSGIDGDITDKSLNEIKTIIEQHKDYYLQGNDIYQHGQTILDPKLVKGLNIKLPNDVRNNLLNLIRNGKTDYTLWDTMVKMSGRNWGNEFTQQLVDEVWKSQDTNGLSELFQIAHNNGLDINMGSSSWNSVLNTLNKIYQGDGFGQYRQFIDRGRLSSHLNKLISGKLTVEDLSHYTTEQRSVLSQTAFLYVHKDSFEELFFDQISGGKIGSLNAFTKAVSDNVGTGSSGFDLGLDNLNLDGLSNLGIRSVPLSFGRNRIFEE